MNRCPHCRQPVPSMRFWSYPERDTCLCGDCSDSYSDWCALGYDPDLWWAIA